MDRMKFEKVDTTNIVKVTERAVLIELDNGEEASEKWIPRSVLSNETDKQIESLEGQPATLSVHEWFVKKERLK